LEKSSQYNVERKKVNGLALQTGRGKSVITTGTFPEYFVPDNFSMQTFPAFS